MSLRVRSRYCSKQQSVWRCLLANETSNVGQTRMRKSQIWILQRHAFFFSSFPSNSCRLLYSSRLRNSSTKLQSVFISHRAPPFTFTRFTVVDCPPRLRLSALSQSHWVNTESEIVRQDRPTFFCPRLLSHVVVAIRFARVIFC